MCCIVQLVQIVQVVQVVQDGYNAESFCQNVLRIVARSLVPVACQRSANAGSLQRPFWFRYAFLSISDVARGAAYAQRGAAEVMRNSLCQLIASWQVLDFIKARCGPMRHGPCPKWWHAAKPPYLRRLGKMLAVVVCLASSVRW